MIPNLFFKVKIPQNISQGMIDVIELLKKSRDKEECLKKAYNILTTKIKGCRSYVDFFDLFITDPNKLWEKKHSHCTNLNYLLRILLIKSGFFQEQDIKLKLTLIHHISIHQYLVVRINKDKFIDLDPWGESHGIKFGNHS